VNATAPLSASDRTRAALRLKLESADSELPSRPKVVARARQRLASGFYDDARVLDLALDRMIDAVLAERDGAGA